MKSILLAISFVLSVTTAALATKPIQPNVQKLDVSTFEIGKGATLENGVLRIERAKADEGESKIHLFDIDSPGIRSTTYLLKGQVRYENITGEAAMLEMWNHLPAEKGGTEIATQFFSKTAAESGPMQKLTGTQEWREFQLPALVNDGTGRRPLKLTINALLPGKGLIEIRDLELIDPLPGTAGARIKGQKVPMKGPVLYALLIGLGVGVGLIIMVFISAIKKQKADRELEKMDALDS